MDHYETLGVARTATAREVRDTYRRLVKDYHPDHTNSSEKLKELDPIVAKAKFDDIQVAWNYFEKHIDFSKMVDSEDPVERIIVEDTLYPFEEPWGPPRVCRICSNAIKESVVKYADKCPSCGRRGDTLIPDYGCDRGIRTLAAFTLNYGKGCVQTYSSEEPMIGKFRKWNLRGGNCSDTTVHCNINFGGAYVSIGTKREGGRRFNFLRVGYESGTVRNVESNGTMDDPIEQILSIVDPSQCIPLRREKTRKRLEDLQAFVHFDQSDCKEECIKQVVNHIWSPTFLRGCVNDKASDDLLKMAKSVSTATSPNLPTANEGSIKEFIEFVYDLTTIGAVTWDGSHVFNSSDAAVVTSDGTNFRMIFSRIPATTQLSTTSPSNFRFSLHKKKGDKIIDIPIIDTNSIFLSNLAEEIKRQSRGS